METIYAIYCLVAALFIMGGVFALWDRHHPKINLSQRASRTIELICTWTVGPFLLALLWIACAPELLIRWDEDRRKRNEN